MGQVWTVTIECSCGARVHGSIRSRAVASKVLSYVAKEHHHFRSRRKVWVTEEAGSDHYVMLTRGIVKRQLGLAPEEASAIANRVDPAPLVTSGRPSRYHMSGSNKASSVKANTPYAAPIRARLRGG